MSAGLYTIAEVARYLGTRPQEVARMIRDDGLPVVELPGAQKLVRKVTLHGLHGWLAARHSGTAFMSVDQLAAEVAAAQCDAMSAGLLQLRSAVETVFAAISREMGRGTERMKSETIKDERKQAA